jgi:PD-(D/E)XK nuclease superfamily
MSESDATSTAAELEALKALQADASELERIEELLDRFNVFEAIGFVGQEVMHSRFLAFLLDPRQNHGLGDHFLGGFLRKCSESTDGDSLPQIADHDGGLGKTTVQTEVYTGDGRIDILILNESEGWAVIVENKIWTTEHSDQLERYYRFVKRTYRGCQVRGIYVTPFGATPTHKRYLPLSYGAVSARSWIASWPSEALPQARTLGCPCSTTDMVRRHIVGDSEVARLCQEIYQKHKRAFNLIIEHLPDPIYPIRFSPFRSPYPSFSHRTSSPNSLPNHS